MYHQDDQSRTDDIPNDLQITTAVPVYAAGAGGFAGSGLTLRKDFPESWIWETVSESRFVRFGLRKTAAAPRFVVNVTSAPGGSNRCWPLQLLYSVMYKNLKV